MQLEHYNLKIGKRELLKDVTITFEEGKIHHILGQNGVGKSIFAKDLMYQSDDAILISSYSNIPDDITYADLLQLLCKKFDVVKVNRVGSILDIKNINPKLVIRKLSDGQKQKLKLLTYILFDKSVIILDEMTNALDKGTTNEIYNFLKDYSQKNPDKTLINITHNLSDLKQMAGSYYLFEDQSLQRIDSMESVIHQYIGGENHVLA